MAQNMDMGVQAWIRFCYISQRYPQHDTSSCWSYKSSISKPKSPNLHNTFSLLTYCIQWRRKTKDLVARRPTKQRPSRFSPSFDFKRPRTLCET